MNYNLHFWTSICELLYYEIIVCMLLCYKLLLCNSKPPRSDTRPRIYSSVLARHKEWTVTQFPELNATFEKPHLYQNELVSL